LSDYLTRNNLLSSQQFGFRSGFPSQEALLTVTNDWHNILATNHQATAVFFVIRKAFDSVPHHHILTSLSSLGVSGPLLACFSNYLTDRQQRVVLDGVSSSLTQITCGVLRVQFLAPYSSSVS